MHLAGHADASVTFPDTVSKSRFISAMVPGTERVSVAVPS